MRLKIRERTIKQKILMTFILTVKGSQHQQFNDKCIRT